MMLPYDLRRGPYKRLLFQNLATRIVLTARPDQLEDRDGLIRLFASQVRAQIADTTSIAHLQLLTMAAKLDHWAPGLTRALVRPRPRSLHGSTWGEVLESGTVALGAVVDHYWSTAAVAPGAGVSLNIGKHGKRHLAVFMHTPLNLTDTQAARLLDEWLEDLYRP
jgi:hypothetical protein